MSTLFKLALAMGLALFMMVVAPRAAQATSGNGYPCNVTLSPASSSLGSNGNVYVQFYTQANCGGTFMAGGYLCSTGATDGACTTAAQYGANQLLAVFQAFVNNSGKRVFFYAPTTVYTSLAFLDQ